VDRGLLALLSCPFCGGDLRIVGDAAVGGHGLASGLLGCQCNVYPVVDGIPYIRDDATARELVARVNSGDHDGALLALLSQALDADTVRELVADPKLTFQSAVRLVPGLEADYLLYRFSDPTYLGGLAALHAVVPKFAGRPALDVGGGAGHLTRTISQACPTVLADIFFPKLWLARRFIAPRIWPICCDANDALPLRSHAFGLVFTSDAFHYVWRRRALATDLQRVAAHDGAIVLAHAHNALVEHPSEGMPLAPDQYRNLFGDLNVQMYDERDALAAALDGRALALDDAPPAAALAGAPALIVVASTSGLKAASTDLPAADGVLALNPLYERTGDAMWELRFPSDFYADEYAACSTYLPATLELDPDLLDRPRHDPVIQDLLRKRVLLDVPPQYV
jgi:uncharacterized protein YbaR (Trm112 family)